MSEGTESILSLPIQEITERHSPSVGTDNMRGRDVAGPFFDAGGNMMCLSQMPKYAGNLHRPDVHVFFLMVQGRMEVRLDRETVIAEPGDLVCAPAGILHQRTALEPIVWIYIKLNDVPRWQPLKEQGASIRKYESADLMYILVKKIIDAHSNQDLYSARCARENSETLAKLLERELRQSTNEWKSERMDRFVDLLERIRKNPEYEWDRAFMAQQVNMSERNLTRVFRRTFGISPAKMVARIRMELAVKMLQNPNRSLRDIAGALGYQTTPAFSRVFKNYTGVAPGGYRQSGAKEPRD